MTKDDKEYQDTEAGNSIIEGIKIDINSIPNTVHERREWIKYHLKIKGLTLAEIARKTNISRQCYSMALKNPYPSCEFHIARFLGVTPSDLWPERYRNGLPIKPHGANND